MLNFSQMYLFIETNKKIGKPGWWVISSSWLSFISAVENYQKVEQSFSIFRFNSTILDVDKQL